MKAKGIQAFYVNGSDPHLSEYLPARWQTRAFISGFTGSYGWLAITLSDAALWTDSRYFLQAEQQLKDTGISLMKARLPETPDVTDWLISKLSANDKVGINSECIAFSLFRKMKEAFSAKEIQVTKIGDLLNDIWENRPAVPSNEIFEHELKFAGESRKSKISRIQKELQRIGADMQILTALDDIAWTFNLRGSDIEYNPVFLSYALIDQKKVILFANPDAISEKLKEELTRDDIQLYKYSSVFCFLKEIKAFSKIYIDPDKTNLLVVSAIPSSCSIIEGISISCQLKAQKNRIEIANIGNAMIKDGVALVEFWNWLENIVGTKTVTEYDIALKLGEFRQNKKDFKGESFFPIIGYKEHGAIVHFHVEKDNALTIEKDGILLFDSGGHYLDGTTDTTRTIALGIPTEKQKSDFTLALKGVIALTKSVFPENTRGYHLDVLARKALWKHGLNYGHGTGHGVGFYLNVHEGPMSIRMEFNDQTIKEGMVLSNEPAFYREGEYGIRTENMMVCVEKDNTQFGRFLGFETLTLCPTDIRLIATELLTDNEIEWINNYHNKVFEKLSPALPAELHDFLFEKTRPI